MAFTEWFGFFLPAKTPPDVVQRLNAGIRTALASQDVIDGLAVSYLEVMPTSPAQLAAMLKADTEQWGPLVKTIGFTADA